MSKDSFVTWLSKGGLFRQSTVLRAAEAMDLNSESLYELSDVIRNRQQKAGVISEISISNFKSVRDARVGLSPLTVVVGRNSSGKSSLIQALLLSVQHLTNRYSSDRKISLNQHLVRLGSFSQMHRHGAESSITTIGIECRGGIGWSADLAIDDSSEKSRNAELSMMRGHSNVSAAKFSFELSNVKAPKVAYPVVLPGHNVPSSKHEIYSADYKIIGKPNRSTFPEASQIVGSDEVEALFPYALLRDPAQEQMHPIPLEEMDLLRALAELLHSHCVDTTTAVEASKGLMVTKSVGSKAQLLNVLRSLLANSLSEVGQEGIESLIAVINDGGDLDEEKFEILANFVHSLAFCFTTDEILERVSSDLHRRMDAVKRSLASSSVADIRELLSELWKSDHFNVDPPTVLVPVTLSGRYPELEIINFELMGFRLRLRSQLSNVYHVGPIRDPESPADPISDPLYVGSKGEHTVEVLQREASRRVLDPLTGKTMLFSKALAAALKNLELADGAQIEDRGRERPGISMTPFHEKSDPFNSDELSAELNAVGVGVSQVLPVVMQCLLAQPGDSMVIVEQPELHLHPRLEQTLADFFLACVRSGRQILIETHSEHLVNRLRLRIAEDMSDEVSSLVKVVFAEQRDGVTSYREPGIDQYGNTEFGDADQDWPEGFLDLTLDEARRLLKAANERKISEIERKRAEIENHARNRQRGVNIDESVDDDDDDDF
jgi:predicted ATPase